MTGTSLIINEASRRAIRSRDLALSRELKLAARQARRNPTPFFYRLSTMALGSAFLLRDTFGRGFMISFVVLALIPALSLIGYFFLVASNQFSSEVKFAVRSGEPSLLDTMA